MNQSQRRQFLIRELLNDKNMGIPHDAKSQKLLLRGLMNVRRPYEIDSNFLAIQDAYLKQETQNKGVVDADTFKDGISLWQGDITRLKCDAIVNAANSAMLGCFIPNHKCIDNCIHTYAGIQLRLECDSIMKKQGYDEPIGKAKITYGYNLPCEYVIHTVGPIIYDKVCQSDEKLLRSCYISCLELAEEKELNAIAFCCISTGEFHFPNELAAKIAIEAVKEFMRHSKYVKKVIFNVFKDIDKEIYARLLQNF